MSNTTIQESFATGEEINPIVSQIEGALAGVNRGHAIIALISMALILMYPEIQGEDLQAGVKDISQFICLYLDGKSGETGVAN